MALGCCGRLTRTPRLSVTNTSGTPCSEQGPAPWLVKRMPPTTAAPLSCHEPMASVLNAVHGGVPGGMTGRVGAGGGCAGVSTHCTAPGLRANPVSGGAEADVGAWAATVVGGTESLTTVEPLWSLDEVDR